MHTTIRAYTYEIDVECRRRGVHIPTRGAESCPRALLGAAALDWLARAMHGAPVKIRYSNSAG